MISASNEVLECMGASGEDYSGPAMRTREFDLILYGATGFTGRQAVDYLRRHAPPKILWAIAGRNHQRLEELRAGVPALLCDSTNESQANALVARTHVLMSTAGPFELYSDQLVAACVERHTHYVDISGEVAWVRSLIERFHAQAERDGTRIIPLCGFDSVPCDLGVYLLSKKLGPRLAVAKAYFQVGGGRPNGGTIASAHHTYSSKANETGKDLFLLNPGCERAAQAMERDPVRASYDHDVKAWTAPFPMSIIDSRVVRRSCALNGLDVAYQEYVVFYGVLAPVWAALAATGTALFYRVLAWAWTRKLLHNKLKAGSGPSEQSMDNGFFRCRVWGRTREGSSGEVTLCGKGDPANRITVLCLCESAFAIVMNPDELPKLAGVLTPSTGIGDALVARLRSRGITFSESP